MCHIYTFNTPSCVSAVTKGRLSDCQQSHSPDHEQCQPNSEPFQYLLLITEACSQSFLHIDAASLPVL